MNISNPNKKHPADRPSLKRFLISLVVLAVLGNIPSVWAGIQGFAQVVSEVQVLEEGSVDFVCYDAILEKNTDEAWEEGRRYGYLALDWTVIVRTVTTNIRTVCAYPPWTTLGAYP